MNETEAPRPVPLTPFESRFGHPRGLAVLFMTEMWERMSYYGMRALLVLYMTKFLFQTDRITYWNGDEVHQAGDPSTVIGLGAVRGSLEAIFGAMGHQELSSQLYGVYTALVYLTPILGGYLADKYMGQRRAVVVGGLIMAVGQFVLMVDRLFFVALLILIVGNGLFKPNVSTQVGALYAEGDERRDRAFSIFYVGINLGALLAALVCGTLGQKYGWQYGFAAAGVGMIIGVVQYLWGQRHLAPDSLAQKQGGHQAEATGQASAKVAQFTKDEWQRIVALVVLCLLNVVFWGVYEQQGNTMQLWADEQTNWPTLFGWAIPSTWYQSFNPFMIFAFTPFITALWKRQAAAGKEPSSVAKMAIGCTVLGLSYIVMVVGAQVVGTGKGSLLWPFACTAMLTLGELYLSPIGLSLVTKVAPARVVNTMMGVWFLSSFLGNYLSGYIGTYYTRIPKETFFSLLCGLGLLSGIMMFLVLRPMKRVIGANV